jgi:flagellar biosynthetic protein FliR
MDPALLPSVADLLAPYVMGAALILVRLAVMMSFVPAFGNREIPMRVRVVLSVVMTVALDLALGLVRVPIPADPFRLGLMVAREATYGFGLGLMVHLIIATASTAGAVASMTMGLGMSNMVDPTSGENSLTLGGLMGVIAALMFVAFDGHHIVIAALFAHLRRIPVGEVTLALPTVSDIMVAGGHLIRTSLILSAPVLVVTLLINVSIGFISRVVPAVNLFGIGLGLLILGALVALQQEGHALLRVLEVEMERLPDQMFRFAPTS